MPKFSLEIKVELENVTNLQPEFVSSYRWHLKFCCSRCKETSDRWNYVSIDEILEIPGSRGTANFVEKCKFCDCQNSLSILSESFEPYVFECSNQWRKMIVFECRGLEPTDFEPRGIWVANSVESSSKFEHIDLNEKEWADFDEKAQTPVGIFNFESRFSKIR
uniref:Uncharacterized protein n=1 Tax=Romanomermis culicivorax TaxID=13658 RepID=A0A915LBX8_ROMCU